MEILEKLAEMFKDYRGENMEIEESTTFDQLGFDSLDQVEMLMKIEDEYDIEFPDDLEVENAGQLVKKIQELIK